MTTPGPRPPGSVVVDASALVDLLIGSEHASAVAERLRGTTWHAPAHCDAEVLSALGRLHRGGHLSLQDVETAVEQLTVVPMTRHPVADLLAGAWQLRARVRLLDGLYISLGTQLDVPVVTTDHRLARAHERAEGVVG